MTQIRFEQDNDWSYPHRTLVNVTKSDATLIFSCDRSSPGIRCTLNRCYVCERPAFIFSLSREGLTDNYKHQIDLIIQWAKDKDSVKLNIAGNDICNMSKLGWNQNDADESVRLVLSELKKHIVIESVRSGGQTGVDEAGIRVASELDIPEVLCYAARGWLYRDLKGDHRDEKAFKARFK